MSEKNEYRSGGIGLLGMLAVLFIGLKLTGYIEWSWWYVTMPLWLPWAVILGVLAIAGGGLLAAFVCAMAYEAFTTKKKGA